MRRIVVVALLVIGTGARAAPPPNVVMLISDDQAWTDYSFMDHEAIQTPNIDRLAEEGALFTRGYVPGSLCRCSLATLVTGLYPHQHAITSNDPPEGVDRHLMLQHIEAATTLPTLLAEKNYLSMQTGKWWEGNYRLGGFTSGMTHGDTARGGRHGDEGLKIGREGLQPIVDFFDEAGDRPFFLWYAPFLPHTPHNPPERFLAKYRKEGRSEHVAKYWAMCEWFDETVGEVMELLEARGLRENTLVVYVTDNGWIQMEDSPRFAPRSKRSPYDGGLRTPVILNWPGTIAPMRDDETLVMSLDLIPTILGVAGVEPDHELPGIDLLPVCAGKPVKRDRIFGEIFAHDAVDITKPETSLEYRWCIDGDWKLILPHKKDEAPALYHIVNDPFETKDLAAAEPKRVKKMAAWIQDWWPVAEE